MLIKKNIFERILPWGGYERKRWEGGGEGGRERGEGGGGRGRGKGGNIFITFSRDWTSFVCCRY